MGDRDGTYTFTDDEIDVQMYRQPVEASIEVAQILPGEYEQVGFTYYDEEVQQRLAQSLMTMMARGGYTMDAPLAVLNPFGTGSNGPGPSLHHRLQLPDPLHRHHRR